MNEPRICPVCSAPVPSDAPPGPCPVCLLQAGLDASRGSLPTTGLSGQGSPASSGGFVPPAPSDLAAKFPQLEILELLGRGGMGAVYKARQKDLDRLVALKILPPEVGRQPAFAERFTREARALARLNHPHIVAVYETGKADDLFYIVMEYVDGVDLRRAMNERRLAPTEGLAIVRQICDALEYAHDEGIVHRDIKPENILIDNRGRAKVADFSLSKLMAQDEPQGALTGTHQVMGTLRYMAPEQMEGSRHVDHRADIYALGVVFYELLTGEVPLGRFEPPSHKVEIDVRLDEVVLRALAREPAKRYQRAGDVKTEVDAITAHPQTPPPKPVASAPDSVVRPRLAVICLLSWLPYTATLCGLHWGYLNEAKWYFSKELPYSYLSGAWFLSSAWLAFFLGYWWYMLVKSPAVPRSLQDFLRHAQTPDRRVLKLWIPATLYLAVWVGSIVVTMSFFDDNVQSTTMIALVIVAPLVFMASCWWALGKARN